MRSTTKKDVSEGHGPNLSRFDWDDALRMEDQLTEDERMLRANGVPDASIDREKFRGWDLRLGEGFISRQTGFLGSDESKRRAARQRAFGRPSIPSPTIWLKFKLTHYPNLRHSACGNATQPACISNLAKLLHLSP